MRISHFYFVKFTSGTRNLVAVPASPPGGGQSPSAQSAGGFQLSAIEACISCKRPVTTFIHTLERQVPAILSNGDVEELHVIRDPSDPWRECQQPEDFRGSGWDLDDLCKTSHEPCS